MTSALIPVLVAVCGLLLVLILGRKARGRYRRWRLIVDTPTSNIGQLDSGFREVSGRLCALGELVEAPLSQTMCCYYRFVVEEKKVGADSTEWIEVVKDEAYSSVCIDDGSGRVKLLLREAELILKDSHRVTSGIFDTPSPELQDRLQKRYFYSTKGWLLNKTLRCTETKLVAGDEVYALGRVSFVGDGFEMVGGDIFLVGDRPESEIAAKVRNWFIGWAFTVAVAALIGLGGLWASLSAFGLL